MFFAHSPFAGRWCSPWQRFRRLLVRIAVLGFLLSGIAHGETLEIQTAKAFREIGLTPAQTPQYTSLFEAYLTERNAGVRRIIDKYSGEKRRSRAARHVRRAAKRSVRQMSALLSDEQLPRYRRYLELANALFLREAGLLRSSNSGTGNSGCGRSGFGILSKTVA